MSWLAKMCEAQKYACNAYLSLGGPKLGAYKEKEDSSLVFDLGCCTLVCAMCVYDAENIVIFGEKEIVYC